MQTLDFRDGLEANTFAGGNMYMAAPLVSTGLRFAGDGEKPYILRSGKHPNGELMYCSAVQFRGRELSVAKVKEIFDSAPFLIEVKSFSQGVTYLIGKGFFAARQPTGEIEPLMVAVCKDGPVSIEDVKLLVFRPIIIHSKVFEIAKYFYSSYPGDVVITSNIFDHLRIGIWTPRYETISEKEEYEKLLVKRCLETIIRSQSATQNIPH